LIGEASQSVRPLRDIGQEDRQVRQVLSEVEEFARLLDLSPGLREVLEAGHVNRRNKQSALDQVLSKPVSPLHEIVLASGRQGTDERPPSILDELRRWWRSSRGSSGSKSPSPSDVSPQKETLKEMLERRTGKKVVLEETVDPAVLGGSSSGWVDRVRRQRAHADPADRENLQKGEAVAMSIRAEEITEILKSQIKGFEKRIDVAETGVVLSVGDGIARVHGLERRWRASSSISRRRSRDGAQLEEDNVGVVLLGDDPDQGRTRSAGPDESSRCRAATRWSAASSTPSASGGRPGPGRHEGFPARRDQAPGIVSGSLKEPLQTGLKAIDAMIPSAAGSAS